MVCHLSCHSAFIRPAGSAPALHPPALRSGFAMIRQTSCHRSRRWRLAPSCRASAVSSLHCLLAQVTPYFLESAEPKKPGHAFMPGNSGHRSLLTQPLTCAYWPC